MQTSYSVNQSTAIAGQPVGPRSSVPKTLPALAQITLVSTANGSGTDDWVISITDDETGQAYSLTATGSATEATLAANLEAAFAADAKLRDLFTLSVDSSSDVDATFTAKHGGRSYTFAATGGTGANTITTSQAAGGSDLALGIMVALASTPGQMRALASTDTADNVAGLLFRTDANHYQDYVETLSSVPVARRAGTYEVMEEGRCWVTSEDAVTLGDPVYVRKAQTSSAGVLGAFRSSPAGTAQVTTVAPAADQPSYALTLQLRDADGNIRTFNPDYTPTDGTTAVADAIDGLYDAIVDELGGDTSSANGLGVTVTESDTLLTLTTDAGVSIVDLSPNYADDTEAATSTVTIGTADEDAIDVSAFCRWETECAAGGLALLRIHKHG